MKLSEKQIGFIKDAYNHSDVCEGWKSKIRLEFPELFKSEIEVGKWYKNTESRAIICINSLDNKEENYGIGNSGIGWANSYFVKGSRLEKYTPATKQEVETSLIAEAKKRGFKEGVVFNSVKRDLQNGYFSYYENVKVKNRMNVVIYNYETALLNSGFECIFSNGVWASIIEEEKPSKIDIERLKIVAEIEGIKEKLNQLESKL